MPDRPAPPVQMLWEACEPLSALQERFGFEDAQPAAGWVTATVEQHWGVRVDSCRRIVLSDRNALAWLGTSSGELLAKWSVAPERFARLSRVARLAGWLRAEGLPVSAPLPSSDGSLQLEVGDASLSVQRVLPGTLLDPEDAPQVRAAGAVLAALHLALDRYPEAAGVLAPDDRSGPLGARITTWAESAGEQVPPAARDALLGLVAAAPVQQPPTQLLHGDYRSANVLCVGSQVSGVLDLEETRRDACIDEVARSAVMLGTRYRDWAPVAPVVRRTFLAGYTAVRPLSPLEASWWDAVALWYAVRLVPSGQDPTGWGAAALTHLAEVAPRA